MPEPKELKVNKFTVGTTIFLYYKAGCGSWVHVDFCSGKQGEILLHFNPRYDQNCLVLNLRKADVGWEQEERPLEFPIEPGMTDMSLSIPLMFNIRHIITNIMETL